MRSIYLRLPTCVNLYTLTLANSPLDGETGLQVASHNEIIGTLHTLSQYLTVYSGNRTWRSFVGHLSGWMYWMPTP